MLDLGGSAMILGTIEADQIICTERMWLEIRQLFETLSLDEQVRCIMLSGAGDQAFCSGLDVQVQIDS